MSVLLATAASSGVQLATTAHSDAAGADHASLTYRNGEVVLKGLELHRVWVPGLGDDHDHETATAATEEPDHSCTDNEAGVIKVRGLSTQRGIGQVQVWIDVRPGHEGTAMVRVRVRAKTGCEGHDDGHDDGHSVADTGDHGEPTDGVDHGAWTHNSGWIPLHKVNVHSRA